MKYIITKQNITVVIDEKPYSINFDDPKYEKVKYALDNFQPDYIIRENISPSKEVKKAIELLKSDFKKEE